MKKIILTIVLTLGALQADSSVLYNTQDTIVHYDTQDTKSQISKPNHPKDTKSPISKPNHPTTDIY